MASVKIEKYQMAWNAGKNEGMLMLLLEGGGTTNLPIDSAEEGSFLLDLLRNDESVMFDDENELILTGFDAVGDEV